MTKNKKGFTLVELLAVIVVLAIILVIATMSINKTVKKARTDSFYETANIIRKTSKNICSLNGSMDLESLKDALDYSDKDISIEIEVEKDETGNIKYVIYVIGKKDGEFEKIDLDNLKNNNNIYNVVKDANAITFETPCSYKPIVDSDEYNNINKKIEALKFKVSGKLGDDVYYQYDNGKIRIYGNGDINNKNTGEINDENYFKGSLINTLYEKLLRNYGFSSDKIIDFLRTGGNGFQTIISIGNTYDDAASLKNTFNDIIKESDLTNEEKHEVEKFVSDVPYLKSFIIEEGITSLPENIVSGISGVDFIMPNSIKEVGERAIFFSTFKTLKIGNGINNGKIPSYFVVSCKIDKLIIPDGITEISDNAFDAIENVKELTIPSSVKSIGKNALGLYGIEKIYNTTGRKFKWNTILSGKDGEEFVTGSITVDMYVNEPKFDVQICSTVCSK